MTLTDSFARTFFDRHPHAVLVLDSSGRTLMANASAAWLNRNGSFPSFAELTGVDMPSDVAAGLDADVTWNRRIRVLVEGGGWRQLDAHLVAASERGSGPQAFFCVLRDVTTAVDAARDRQEGYNRSKVTTESAPVLVWMTGTDMRFEWVNPPWLKFRGRSLGDEVGDGWYEGVHPEDLEACVGIYEASFAARAAFTLDVRLRRSDGVFRWMLNTGMPRHGRDGEFLGYIGSCVDITARKGLEDQLAERTRVLRMAEQRREEFLARLSHELRNPLSSIANAAGILRTLESDNQSLTFVREIIERQADQLRRMVSDLVDVTRITAGKVVLQREAVSMDDLVGRVVGDVREAKKERRLILDVHSARPGPSCIGDPDRLAQALSALLDNAARFSVDGGTIDVGITVSGGMLSVQVTDHGQGIASDTMPRVFDPYVQGAQKAGTGAHGLGVGLTIARKVARLHGGDVTLDSAGIGLGATATLSLPCDTVGDGAAAAIDASELHSITGSRVLIVEDNDDARETLRLLVELGGNEVLVAASAAEALSLAEQFNPHVVVCDIGLPDADGCDLVRTLRERFPHVETRYIALTGFGRAEDRDRALDSGFDAFLIKPMRSTLL